MKAAREQDAIGQRATKAGSTVPTEGVFTKWSTILAAASLIVAIVGVFVALPGSNPGSGGTPDAAPPVAASGSGAAMPGSPGANRPPSDPPGGARPSATAGPRRSSTPPPAPPSPAYVPADQFTTFGGSYGAFAFSAAGSRLTIGSTGDFYDRGAVLAGTSRCTTTVSFDVRLDPPAYETDVGWGFGTLARGTTLDDQPKGGVLVITPSGTAGDYLAAFSTDPIPGHGGKGFDWHNVADPVSRYQHVVLTARDRTQDADVGGEPLAASLEQAECGRLMFYTWGGATAHIDRILVG